MKTSAKGRAAIKAREGEKLTAYQDSVNIWTIGTGHTSAAGPPAVKKGMKITAAESDEILARDLAAVEVDVNAVKVKLSQNQFDALVSLVFNIGGTAFKKSTLLKKLNAGDFAGAADQFLVWNKAGGKTLKGLTTRRQSERLQFLTLDTGDTAAAPVAAVPVAKTDKTTIEVVQRKLKELGYSEVGGADGKLGKLTKTAILSFRNEHDLPLSDQIDDELLTALDDAQPRDLPRNDATPAQVRQASPEVQTNFFAKIGAVVVGIPAAIGTFFDGVLGNIGVAKGYIDPLKESLSDIPGWVWLLGVAGVAGGLFLVARHGEKKGVEAFQSGERR